MSKVTLNATSFATGGGTGTIGGSISVGQVAYGSGVNTITGDSGFTRDPTTKETIIAVPLLTGLISANYSISNNFFGIGLTGAGQVFDSGSGGFNVLASIDTTPFGGQKDTTVTGYTALGPGASANAQYSYKLSTDVAVSTISAKSSTGKSAVINVKANAIANKVEFVFDTGNYQFPTTSPSAGQVMGYSSANQLDWVTPGGGISIGDAIGGGPTNNAVLFVDGSGNLNDSSLFTFNTSTETFTAGTSTGNDLTVDPTNGIVATSLSGINALSAVTTYGQAFRINTSGGMGQFIEMGDVNQTNNKTRFFVADNPKQIAAVIDGQFNVYAATGVTGKALIVDTNYSGTGYKYVELGDVDSLQNGTYLTVDDLNQYIGFAAQSGTTLSNNIFTANGGNSIIWRGDTTGTVTTLFEQNQNLFGLGFKGTGISWADSSTGVTGLLATIDGSGVGSYAGSTTMGTINNTVGATALIGSNYNTVTSQPEVFINSALGDLDSGLNSNDQFIELLHRDAGTGQESKVNAGVNGVISDYTLVGTITYRAQLGDGVFTFSDYTNSRTYLNLSPATLIYALGDLSDAFNKSKIIINDSSLETSLVTDGAITMQQSGGARLFNLNTITYSAAIGDIDNLSGGGFIVVDPLNNGVSMQRSRFLELQGADVIAANALAVGSGNAFVVNGNTQINTLSGAGWQQGSEVILQFTGTPTIKNLFGSSGADIEFSLAGSVDLVVATKTTVTFRWMGGVWQETARTVQ